MRRSVFDHIWAFWQELRRRRVVRSAGIYLAACWLILQVFDVVLVPIGLPDWFMTLSVWLALLCFPVAIIVSWRYEVTRDGLKRTTTQLPSAPTDRSIRITDYLLICFMVVFVSFVSTSLVRILNTETRTPDRPAAHPNSIAVLPFENLGGESADEYLGRGLAEDILHRLAMLGGIRVASRTAAFELDTTNLDMATIAERLGVTTLLEGSVRRSGSRVRIVAQLIDAQSGYHIWSRSYDREMADLFVVYDEISAAVVNELQLALMPNEDLRVVPPTTDMQAYDYFLQARSMLQRSSSAETSENAQRFFARAVERDPGFALAWAGHCQAYLDWHYYEPELKKIDKARQSCLKSLELAPDLLEGHVALGDLYRKTGQLQPAIKEYEAALLDNNRAAEAWRGLGEAMSGLNRDREAEDALKRAVDLDPDDLANYFTLGDFYFARGHYHEAAGIYGVAAEHPKASASAYTSQGAAFYMMGEFEKAAGAYRKVVSMEPTAAAYSNIGIMYFYNGQFEDAAVMYREAIAAAPENPVWWGNLGDCLQEMEGREDEARGAYRTAAELANDLLSATPKDAQLLTNLAHYHARLGDDGRASEYLAQALLAAPDDVYAHYYAALVHLEAGRRQEALDELSRSVELGYPRVLLAPDPQFAELRDNEDFLALLEPTENGEKH